MAITGTVTADQGGGTAPIGIVRNAGTITATLAETEYIAEVTTK